ncbi:energy-coupling factor transporter transmembrane protein EcfT [Aerococcaceae bacterium NML190938]|nr:energy-coupling factor transporter transmembrane protein EcfT [Aerococcaceae bacterium NML190938]
MSSQQAMIRYHLGNRFFDQLTGATKVQLFLVSVLLMMISFDLRVIVPLFLIHLAIYKSVYEPMAALKFIFRFTIAMNFLNFLLFYLVNPVIGTDLVGTTTILWRFTDHYVIAYETLIYFITRLLKILGTLIISLWFIMSITPSQLASGLNACGVPYRFCTMISLGLRYIPDVHRDFVAIKESMQMRGMELDARKASLWYRLKANTQILLPLILISFEKIEVIASAMDLRGYGQGEKRSYYSELDVSANDRKVRLLIIAELAVLIFYAILTFRGQAPRLWVW